MRSPELVLHEPLQIYAQSLRLSDADFVQLCIDNPDLRIERTKEKNLVIMSPSFTLTGFYHGALLSALAAWNRSERRGFVFDSSAAFFLPDGSLRMQDVSWLSRERLAQVPEQDRDRFMHVVPEFVVEVKSRTDRWEDLVAKLHNWISNGSRLAWLIDPENERALVFRAGTNHLQEVTSFEEVLSGEEVLKGFTFDLRELRFS
jgi:Uma2 family endonuclease